MKDKKSKKIKCVKTTIIVTLISIIFLTILGVLFMGNKDINIKIETNHGDIILELYPDKAPVTVENFLKYVDSGFYENTVFHRIIEDFMIQGGGFLENGSQKKTLAPITLESNNGLKNDKGTIAMARTMTPNSATSQFFINLNNNDFLNYGYRDEGYAVFGKVIDGMSVVEKIGDFNTKTKYGMEDWPSESIIIKKIYRV